MAMVSSHAVIVVIVLPLESLLHSTAPLFYSFCLRYKMRTVYWDEDGLHQMESIQLRYCSSVVRPEIGVP